MVKTDSSDLSRNFGTFGEFLRRVVLLYEGDTRNRWRDGPVCPDVDEELWRLGPDSSGCFGVLCANRKKEEVKRDFGPANKKERGACCEHTPGV
ncbi:hypothetical protein TNCV_1792331 [Trichonephila clavipes]|nr:hypothetical protein TNCV_1792331 [Trichonephila clavipes]